MNRAEETIAVIGAGVSGLTAAHVLARRHPVTLFERNDYPGGHTHTVEIPGGPDASLPVDTGFIVMNHRNYPLLTRLFEQLDVSLQDSDMSFSYFDEHSGLQYSGSGLSGLFADRRNLFRPSFYRLIREILRFFKEAEADLAGGSFEGLSLGDYLDRRGFSQAFRQHHLVPMGAAIWSTPSARMMEFPAEAFVRFFHNHGLLAVNDRPQWKTVAGGSRTYVRRILNRFPGSLHLNTQVQGLRRDADGVTVRLPDGTTQHFDHAVVAAHGDEALALLEDPSDDERRLLGAWQYTDNHAILHTDAGVMPTRRGAWASWNYTRPQGVPADGPATLSYHMNRLQRLGTERDYFLTLNRPTPLADDRVVREMDYDHPVYTGAAMATQAELPGLNGVRRTHFCGSYHGYGFHEDGVRSALKVTRQFGMDL